MITKRIFSLALTFLFLVLFFSASRVLAQGPGSFPTTGIFKIYGYDNRTGGPLTGATVYWSKAGGGSGGASMDNGYFSRSLNPGTYTYTVANSRCSPGSTSGSITISTNRVSTASVGLWCPNPVAPKPPTPIPTRVPTRTPTRTINKVTSLTICVNKIGGGPLNNGSISISQKAYVSYPLENGCNTKNTFTIGETLTITAKAQGYERQVRSGIKVSAGMLPVNFFLKPNPTPTPVKYSSLSICVVKNDGNNTGIPHATITIDGDSTEPVNSRGCHYYRFQNGKKLSITARASGYETQKKETITGISSNQALYFRLNPVGPCTANPSICTTPIPTRDEQSISRTPTRTEAPYTVVGIIYQQDTSGNKVPYIENTLEIRATNTSGQSKKAEFNGDGTFSIGPLRRQNYNVQIMPIKGLIVLSEPTVPVTFSPSDPVENVYFTIRQQADNTQSPTIAPISPKATEKPEEEDNDQEVPIVSTRPSPTQAPEASDADLNNDGAMNQSDYGIWLCEFLGNGTCQETGSHLLSDINNDGKIDLKDFAIWRNEVTF